MGKHALALLAALETACMNVDELGQASAERFQQHPDYAIITSFPGLADSIGARVLAEIGDDRARFPDVRALKAYAGSAHVTRASGRSMSVTHCHIKNSRLANAGWMWAFSATSNCEPARQHYRHRRENGGRHAAANRHLSTNSSASSTTAYNASRPSTSPRHSPHRYPTRPRARDLCPESGHPHRVPCEKGKEDPRAAQTRSLARRMTHRPVRSYRADRA